MARVPTAQPIIRVADPRELVAIGELTVAAYAAGGGLALGADDPYASVLRDPASRPLGTTVYVAVDPGDPDRVLGAVTYIPAGSPVADVARDGEAEIRMLAVAVGHQGRGIGRLLVRAAIDRARAEARPALVLCVVGSNGGARALYEHLGFIRTPDRDWDPLPGFRLLSYRRST